MWRSWLAHASGGREVGSSSLLAPTRRGSLYKKYFPAFLVMSPYNNYLNKIKNLVFPEYFIIFAPQRIARGAQAVVWAEIRPVRPDSDNADVGTPKA